MSTETLEPIETIELFESTEPLEALEPLFLIPDEEWKVVELASTLLDCKPSVIADPFGIRFDWIEQRLIALGHQCNDEHSWCDVLKEHYPTLYKAIEVLNP